MKDSRTFLLVVALALALASPTPESHAAGMDIAHIASLEVKAASAPAQHRVWGWIARALCRAGSGGPHNPLAGFCLIALLDAITS